jgi:hypothetical protein
MPAGVAQPKAAVPPPAAAAQGSGASPSNPNKAALLLALARSVGVSGEDLAQAMQQHNGTAAAPHASTAGGAPAAPSGVGTVVPAATSAFVAAAAPAAPLLPLPGAAGQHAQPVSGLDLAQLQQAARQGALPRDISEDAGLLLQLVTAAEQAHQAAANTGDRMRFLSLKLFKVRFCGACLRVCFCACPVACVAAPLPAVCALSLPPCPPLP